MSNPILKIDGVSWSGDENNLAHFWHIKHPADKDGLQTSLFGFLETDAEKNICREIVELFNEAFQIFYERIPANKARDGAFTEHEFELWLHEIEQEMNKSELDKAFRPPQRPHLLLAVITGPFLTMVTRGTIHAYLWRGEKEKEVYDLVKAASNSTDTPDKIFSHILSGPLQNNDVLLFTSQSVPVALPMSTLKEISERLHPRGATEYIKAAFQKSRPSGTLAVIAAHYASLKDASRQKINPHYSVESLRSTETITEKFLSPSDIPNIKRAIKNLINELRGREYYGRGGVKRHKNPDIALIVAVGGVVLALIRTLLKTVRGILFFFAIIFFNWGGVRSKIAEKYKAAFKQILNYPFSKYASLPRRTKILFLSTLVLGTLFAQGVLVAGIRARNLEQTKTFEKEAANIFKKMDAAQAEMLAKKNGEAKILLKEVADMIQNLPVRTKKNRETKQEFENKLTAAVDAVNKIFKIKNPRVIGDFGGIGNNNRFFTEKNGTFFAIDYEKGAAMSLNSKNGEIKILNSPSAAKILTVRGGDAQNAVMLSERSEIIAWKYGTEEFMSLGRATENNIADLDIWAGKIYTLAPQKSQIFSQQKNDSGLGAARPWLKESVELKNAISMTIDGSIYALLSDGAIKKFHTGFAKTFSQEGVEPALASPEKITTEAAGNYLYVLEPKTRRVVVYDKRGALAAQYISDQFNDLRDVLPREQKKKIYILNNTTVYEIVAAHIN